MLPSDSLTIKIVAAFFYILHLLCSLKIKKKIKYDLCGQWYHYFRLTPYLLVYKILIHMYNVVFLSDFFDWIEQSHLVMMYNER